MKKLIGTATYIGNVRGINTTLGNTPHTLFEDHPNGIPYVESGTGENINVYGSDWVIATNSLDIKKTILKGISDMISSSVEISPLMSKIERKDIQIKFNRVISILDDLKDDLITSSKQNWDIVGVAYYCGHDVKLIEEFSLSRPQTLYNTEGFYIRGRDGRQVLIGNKDWEMVLTPES